MEERTFCGKSYEEMNKILDTLCNLGNSDTLLTDEEDDAMEIALNCVCTVMNRMIGAKDLANMWDE